MAVLDQATLIAYLNINILSLHFIHIFLYKYFRCCNVYNLYVFSNKEKCNDSTYLFYPFKFTSYSIFLHLRDQGCITFVLIRSAHFSIIFAELASFDHTDSQIHPASNSNIITNRAAC